MKIYFLHQQYTMRLHKIGLLPLLFCLGTAQAASCKLENIEVKPLPGSKNEVFVAKTAHLELHFASDGSAGNVDAFPEPLLQVINKQTNKQCHINGGIWVRKNIYVSQDERTLLTHEYSGSNDFLNLYNTADCSKIQEIDISYAHWKLSADQLSVQPVHEGKQAKVIRLYKFGADCKTSMTTK